MRLNAYNRPAVIILGSTENLHTPPKWRLETVAECGIVYERELGDRGDLVGFPIAIGRFAHPRELTVCKSWDRRISTENPVGLHQNGVRSG